MIKVALYYREGRKKEAADLSLKTAMADRASRDKALRFAVKIYSELRDHKKVVDVCNHILRFDMSLRIACSGNIIISPLLDKGHQFTGITEFILWRDIRVNVTTKGQNIFNATLIEFAQYRRNFFSYI